MIWVIYAYNVMFNLGTGMENVTYLKNRTLFQYGAFECGPASELLAGHQPTIRTLSPVRGKLLAELALKFSDVSNLFRSFDFRDFLEKHLYFFIRAYSQNIVKMLLDNIRLYFILS